MCATCGCDTHHDHDHEHHHHDHDHEHKVIDLGIDVLAKSNALAAQNRAWLKERGIYMLNVMSSPGAGKTTLLEKTAAAFPNSFVIEGDQATTIDRDRLREAGATCIQVNTGTGCHLDPHMVLHALEDLDVPNGATVFVENVGNLVCPALFDLGEEDRVVILSTPEGDDKPLKYPHMFQSATLVLVNKIDLLEHVPFDLDRFRRALAQVKPDARVETISACRERGLDPWYAWLRDRGS